MSDFNQKFYDDFCLFLDIHGYFMNNPPRDYPKFDNLTDAEKFAWRSLEYASRKDPNTPYMPHNQHDKKLEEVI